MNKLFINITDSQKKKPIYSLRQCSEFLKEFSDFLSYRVILVEKEVIVGTFNIHF